MNFYTDEVPAGKFIIHRNEGKHGIPVWSNPSANRNDDSPNCWSYYHAPVEYPDYLNARIIADLLGEGIVVSAETWNHNRKIKRSRNCL